MADTMSYYSDHDHVDFPHFQYVRVGLGLAREIVDYLLADESVVLLGPRYVGKKLVLSEVNELLRESGHECVFMFTFLDRSWRNHEDLWRAVCGELARVLANYGWQTPSYEDDVNVTEALVRFLEYTPCHIIALLTDVDALPDHLARRVLKAVRRLTTLAEHYQGRFTAVLTGSVGLAPLVYGADSDFDCATQFVIQGYDGGAFAAFADGLIAATGWPIAERENCHEQLFRLCGGDIYLLRILFWGILEHRRTHGISADIPVTEAEIVDSVEFIRSPTTGSAEFLIHTVARIENSAGACEMLARLLEQDRIPVPQVPVPGTNELKEAPPTELELAGLARREDGQLTLASPLVADIARQRFTLWRLGDLLACRQEWDLAFAKYERAIAAEESWVYSPVNRPELRSAVRAFQTALHAKAMQGTEVLDEFFLRGATFLLGFEEVSFWVYRDNKWTATTRATREAQADEIRMKCCSILPAIEILQDGIHPLEKDVAPYAFMVGLPSDDMGLRMAVILGNFRREAPLIRERRSLCCPVIDTYCTAYAQARRIDRVTQAASLRQHLLDTIPAILGAIAGGPVCTRTALETAAGCLREIGYRRVMFSMVNPERTRIVGVLDSRPEGEPDIAARLNLPLHGEVQSVHQYCVRTGEKVLIEDARTHPLAAKELVKTAGVEAAAAIPIRAREHVLGAIFFEREDKKLPSREEVEALEYFAERLSKVIALTDRVSMLETALDEGMNPAMILDRQGLIRYVNERAAKMARLQRGWQSEAALPDGQEILLRESRETLDAALKDNCSASNYIHRPGQRFEWLNLRASPIHDWRNLQIGALLQAQDLTVIGRLFQTVMALAAFPDRESLLKGMLDATRGLGHEWGHLYLLDEDSGKLVGHAQYGFPEGSEGALAFENHTITFDRHWLFGRNGSGAPTSDVPAVLALDLNLPDGAETKTESGIRAVNALDPECPRILRKSPGSFWIDFPLYCRGRQTPLGMLALSCPADLAPERFEILRILAEVASALLAAIEEQEATFQRQVAWQREAMEKAFGATAHHLRARLSALGVLQAEYDEAASGNEEIEKLNEDFSDLLHSLEGELQDIRDRLRPIVAERTRKDVLALFRNTLQRQLPDTAFTLDAEQGRPMADVDTRLLPEVIEELVENAKKAMDREGPLHIDVSIRVIGEGRSIGCVIEFCDNGSGIARELRERVFEDLYSQWPGKKRGNGLGLGFVRRVMEAHGGTARIADSDVGARFVLEFIRFA